MVSEANEPGSESGKRSDAPQEGGASNHLAARLAPRAPGSFAAAAMIYPSSLLERPGLEQIVHAPPLPVALVVFRGAPRIGVDAARARHGGHPRRGARAHAGAHRGEDPA